MISPWHSPASLEWAALLLGSFERVRKKPLLAKPAASSSAEELYNAPFVVVSHGTEPDPVLNYGNAAALKLWELTWERFTHTPSRLTAEPLERTERARLLEQVTRNGFIDNYRGIRISSTGRRFSIENAIVWNVLDAAGAYHGQAATFAAWTYI